MTGLLDRLVYLPAGLAVILAFTGVKLILHWGHGVSHQVPELSTAMSLIVMAAVLTVTTVASLVRSRRDPAVRAAAPPISAAANAIGSGKSMAFAVRTVSPVPAARYSSTLVGLTALARGTKRPRRPAICGMGCKRGGAGVRAAGERASWAGGS